jgi:hypothetical protein
MDQRRYSCIRAHPHGRTNQHVMTNEHVYRE